VRHHLGEKTFIGKTVHTVQTAVAAAAQGADYLMAGNIFTEASESKLEPLGLEFLRDVCAAVTIPVLAFGGILPENAAECIEAGAAGIAVMSGIMQAPDKGAAAEEYWTVLEEAWDKR